jgi:hypothetical protein
MNTFFEVNDKIDIDTVLMDDKLEIPFMKREMTAIIICRKHNYSFFVSLIIRLSAQCDDNIQ